MLIVYIQFLCLIEISLTIKDCNRLGIFCHNIFEFSCHFAPINPLNMKKNNRNYVLAKMNEFYFIQNAFESLFSLQKTEVQTQTLIGQKFPPPTLYFCTFSITQNKNSVKFGFSEVLSQKITNITKPTDVHRFEIQMSSFHS